MAYTKTVWKDYPDTTTKMTAQNLNNIENGIENVDTRLTTAEGEISAMCGMINIWPASVAPNGYLLCDGSLISRTTYANLFSVIGTIFGAGDGSTTFKLPDIKGKTPVGVDSLQTEFDTIGETGGEKTHKLIISEMPSHTHNLAVMGGSEMGAGVSYVIDGSLNGNFIQYAGDGQSHNNLQPYIVLNYIIKY